MGGGDEEFGVVGFRGLGLRVYGGFGYSTTTW